MKDLTARNTWLEKQVLESPNARGLSAMMIVIAVKISQTDERNSASKSREPIEEIVGLPAV